MRSKFRYGLNPVGARRLAILIICAVASLTFAQRVAHERAIEAPTLPPALPATAVLYDQYTNAGILYTVSSTFTDFPTSDSDVADDFVVPSGQTWQVQSIDAEGLYFNGIGPATDWSVFFYTDSAGFPGTQIYSAAHQSVAVNGLMFSVSLTTPAVLNAGTYWVEIQANMTYSTHGEWGWVNRTITSNNPAVFRNPGGAFGVCQNWSRRATTCAIDPSEPDQVYRLNGILGAPTPTPAPGCYANYTTAEGCDALSSLNTGAGNTALGWRSLFSDTTGSFNTGVGGGTLVFSNGPSNTAVGTAALLLNTTGSNNTAVGTDTLVFNDSGSSNIASGYFALMNNTTGGSNTAIGSEALTANTDGNNNTAIGDLALMNSQATSDNVAVGSEAGSGLTTADNNIIIGHHSGVHSVFGEENDRCYIDNIHGAPVSSATAMMVMVDSDGRLGTITADGPGQGGSPSKAISPQDIPESQAMFDLQIQELEATLAQRQEQIQNLTEQVKEQAVRIQKVNVQLVK